MARLEGGRARRRGRAKRLGRQRKSANNSLNCRIKAFYMHTNITFTAPYDISSHYHIRKQSLFIVQIIHWPIDFHRVCVDHPAFDELGCGLCSVPRRIKHAGVIVPSYFTVFLMKITTSKEHRNDHMLAGSSIDCVSCGIKHYCMMWRVIMFIFSA